ncbi:MAG: cytochrome c3 family protein [bacterium]
MKGYFLITRLKAALLSASGLAALLIVVGLPLSMWYTSRPEFCVSCHEMEKRYLYWKKSSHNAVECETCHFEPSAIGFTKGKLGALRQVYVHFTNPNKPIVGRGTPNASCLRCHEEGYIKTLGKKITENVNLVTGDLPPATIYINMAHDKHLESVKGIRCSDCHSAVVHRPRGQNRPHMEVCGKCHDGTTGDNKAFSTRDAANCLKCHLGREEKGILAGGNCYLCHNKDYIESVDKSVPRNARLIADNGWYYTNVRHAKHLSMGIECTNCHTDIRHGDAEGIRPPTMDACVACHNGSVAFDAYDDKNCDKCHLSL